MSRYNREIYLARRGLQNVVANPNKSEKVKKIARQVLSDRKLFDEYVLMRKEKLDAIYNKKVREDRKKNLTGWKKWFISLLPGVMF